MCDKLRPGERFDWGPDVGNLGACLKSSGGARLPDEKVYSLLFPSSLRAAAKGKRHYVRMGETTRNSAGQSFPSPLTRI